MYYSWSDGASLIKKIRVYHPHKAEEACLFAPHGGDNGQLRRIRRHLEEVGYVATPDEADGQHVLRVEKFPSADKLIQELALAGGVQGSYTKSNGDKKPQPSFGEWVKASTMPLSGIAYLLGDACLMLSGWIRREYNELSTGAIWASTGIVLTFFGKKNPDRQVEQLYRNLDTYLKKEGAIQPGEPVTFEQLAGKGGMYDKTLEFLYNHPVEFNNTLQTVGGVQLLRAGLVQRSPYHAEGKNIGSRNWFKAAAGFSVANGQLWGMMIDEKKPASPALEAGRRLTQTQQEKDEKDNRSFIQKTMDWFHEKPLRITGFGAGLNNLLNIGGVIWEKKNINKFMAPNGQMDSATQAYFDGGGLSKELQEMRQKSAADRDKFIKNYKKEWLPEGHALAERLKNARDFKTASNYNLAAALFYLLANGLYGMSSKDREGDLESLGLRDEFLGRAAYFIAHRPQEWRPMLIERVSGFLATQPALKMPSEAIAAQLTRKVRQLDQNPWADAPSSWAGRVSAAPSASFAQGVAPA